MKIFNKEAGFDSKVNFVDERNVFLGYDIDQQCCEYADWFISNKRRNKLPRFLRKNNVKRPPVPKLIGWRFDTKFFKEDCIGNDTDSKMAIFRIVRGKKQKFIHLFNCHNGYYGHGFEFKIGDEKVKEGWL